MDLFYNLPHQYIGFISAGLGVFLLAMVGMHLALRSYAQYQKGYVDGAATTLDALYITMPAQNILYLGVMCVLLVTGLVTLLSGSLMIGMIAGLPAFSVPRIALYILKKKRDELFGIQLVDALMNVSNSLRAGFSLTQAFELVYRELPNPMSQEIRLLCQELRLGLPMEDALNNLYQRMPTPDVDLMVTAISIVRDVGGNLTEVFDNIAHTIRERQRIEGKISALTAQGRLQAVVVCLIPFVLGFALYMIAPQIFQPMFSNTIGWVLMGLCGVLMIIGWLWIRKIVAINI